MELPFLYFPCSHGSLEELQKIAPMVGVHPKNPFLQEDIFKANQKIAYEVFQRFQEGKTLISEGQNSLWLILNFFHDKQYSWIKLSSNPNVTLEMIEDNLDKPWNGYGLSNNPNMTVEFVEAHPEFKWHSGDLMMKMKLSVQDILENPKLQEWNYVSQNKQLDLEEILERQDLPWKWVDVSYHPDFTLRHFLEYPHLPWGLVSLSSNSKVTEADVLRHPEIEWHILGLIMNPNISHQFILKHYPNSNKLHFLYGTGASKSSLTLDFVLDDISKRLGEEPIEKLWSWMELSVNSNISLDQILDHPELPWNPKMISQRDDLTMDFVLDYPELVDPSAVSLNPQLSINDVLDNMMYPWDFDNLVKNLWTRSNRILLRDELLPKFYAVQDETRFPTELVENILGKEYGMDGAEIHRILNF